MLFQFPNVSAETCRFSTILLIFNRILKEIGQAEDIRPPAQICQGAEKKTVFDQYLAIHESTGSANLVDCGDEPEPQDAPVDWS